MAGASRRLGLAVATFLATSIGSAPSFGAGGSAATAEKRPWSWHPFESVDRINGRKTVGVTIDALETILQPHRRLAVKNKAASLVIACEGSDLQVFIALEGELVASQNTPVEYRIDDARPVATTWTGSTDSTAVGLRGAKRAKPFLSGLLRRRRLFFRSTHDVFGVLDTEIDLVGVEEAVSPIRKQCPF